MMSMRRKVVVGVAAVAVAAGMGVGPAVAKEHHDRAQEQCVEDARGLHADLMFLGEDEGDALAAMTEAMARCG